MRTSLCGESQVVKSSFQVALAESLAKMLRPIVRLMLTNGLGCSEFIAIAKAEFVHIASEEYGIRGRPTNVSRIAAMTGLSRKEISKIREERIGPRWTPAMEGTPANVIIHHWQFDPRFCFRLGQAKPLPMEGEEGFAALVGKYAGDIPVGAMRTELGRMGVVDVDDKDRLCLSKRYVQPTGFHEDFVRNTAFSLTNLGNTLVHNSTLATRFGKGDESAHPCHGRFERTAWTDHLPQAAEASFRAWVRQKGEEFIEHADDWIGQNEVTKGSENDTPRTLGVGVYYFEEDLAD